MCCAKKTLRQQKHYKSDNCELKIISNNVYTTLISNSKISAVLGIYWFKQPYMYFQFVTFLELQCILFYMVSVFHILVII